MKPDAGGTPPRHLSAVPGPRKTAGPGASRSQEGEPGAAGSGNGSGARGSGSGGGSGAKPPAKRRTRYTARAAVLLLVFCALVLALAYPLQQYVSQRSQLDKLRKQNAAKAAEVAKLKQELTQWQDPDFVAIEARKRLHYVKPGEVGLRLVGPADGSAGSPTASAPGGAGTAWYSQLWNSVTAAAAASASASATGTAPPTPTTPTAPAQTTPSGSGAPPATSGH